MIGSAAGGGPYSDARSFGIAVTAKGFTCEGTGGAAPYAIEGAELAAGAFARAGAMAAARDEPVDRRSTAGVPQAVQNFRDPISSAPHFAQ